MDLYLLDFCSSHLVQLILTFIVLVLTPSGPLWDFVSPFFGRPLFDSDSFQGVDVPPLDWKWCRGLLVRVSKSWVIHISQLVRLQGFRRGMICTLLFFTEVGMYRFCICVLIENPTKKHDLQHILQNDTTGGFPVFIRCACVTGAIGVLALVLDFGVFEEIIDPWHAWAQEYKGARGSFGPAWVAMVARAKLAAIVANKNRSAIFSDLGLTKTHRATFFDMSGDPIDIVLRLPANVRVPTVNHWRRALARQHFIGAPSHRWVLLVDIATEELLDSHQPLSASEVVGADDGIYALMRCVPDVDWNGYYDRIYSNRFRSSSSSTSSDFLYVLRYFELNPTSMLNHYQHTNEKQCSEIFRDRDAADLALSIDAHMISEVDDPRADSRNEAALKDAICSMALKIAPGSVRDDETLVGRVLLQLKKRNRIDVSDVLEWASPRLRDDEDFVFWVLEEIEPHNFRHASERLRSSPCFIKRLLKNMQLPTSWSVLRLVAFITLNISNRASMEQEKEIHGHLMWVTRKKRAYDACSSALDRVCDILWGPVFITVCSLGFVLWIVGVSVRSYFFDAVSVPSEGPHDDRRTGRPEKTTEASSSSFGLREGLGVGIFALMCVVLLVIWWKFPRKSSYLEDGAATGTTAKTSRTSYESLCLDLASTPYAYKWLVPTSLRGDRALAKVVSCSEQGSLNCFYSDSQWRVDREIVLDAVSRDGLQLQYVPFDSHLRGDVDVALVAVRNAPHAIVYIKSPAMNNRDVVCTSLGVNFIKPAGFCHRRQSRMPISGAELREAHVERAEDIGYIPDASEMKGDADLLVAVLRSQPTPSLFLECGAEAHRNREVVEYVLTHFAKDDVAVALSYCDASLKDDFDLVLLAVQRSGGALRFASERLQSNRTIVLAALGETMEAWEHVPVRLQVDGEMKRAARSIAAQGAAAL